MELDHRVAELLFQVLTEREEKASVAIGSNASFSGWTKTFTDPRLCAPLVDRLTHTHCAPAGCTAASDEWLTRYLTFLGGIAIVKHMPNQSGFDVVGRVFHALADPTRRAIVERLVRRPAPVKVLAEPLAMSLPAVMQHLKVLEEAGVIVTEKVGRVRSCRIEPTALRDAERWLSSQRTEWERQLDQLDDYLKGK